MRALAIATCLFGSAAAAQNAAPLSAIDWLSNSLQNPPRFAIEPPTTARLPLDEVFSFSPLAKINREAVGLISPATAGVSAEMWADTDAAQAIDLLQNLRPGTLPEARALFRRLLLAQVNPPLGANEANSVLLTRIDRLFEQGALDEAEALIQLASANDSQIFQRWFEISLLAGRTGAPCQALRGTPALADDLSIRVICLARSGDWNAAATTVSLGSALGDVSDARAELLIRFLDPQMFEDMDDPVIPTPLTPIDFALRESLALPRPLGTMPLAYYFADLALSTPLRQRMEAGERLVESSAIAPPLLFAAYRGGRPASSGGIWGRAAAVQAVDQAISTDDDTQLAATIATAITAFAEPSLMQAFATEYAPLFAQRNPTAAIEPVIGDIQRILLLARQDAPQWFDTALQSDSALNLAHQISSGNLTDGAAPSAPLMYAIYAAFSETDPASPHAPLAHQLIEDGQQARAAILALQLLVHGPDSPPTDIQLALWLLRQVDMQDSAIRLGAQLLLLERPGA